MDIKAFKENLGLTEIPTELEKLIYFQNNISGFECYSQGFGVLIDNKTGLKSWSENQSFLDKLMPFAQANGCGSFYAIWDDGTGKPINQMPIVLFGDEGGIHIVAENILQLLHLLTYDTEISANIDEAYFENKDPDDYEESEDLEKYLEWLKDDYGLTQIGNPESIIKIAQNKYKTAFDNWIGQYYKVG
jgi:hypothetical protein